MARGRCTSSLEIKSECSIVVCSVWDYQLNFSNSFTCNGRFLSWAYQVTKASLQRAEEEALDKDTGREHSSSNCERLQYLVFFVRFHS